MNAHALEVSRGHPCSPRCFVTLTLTMKVKGPGPCLFDRDSTCDWKVLSTRAIDPRTKVLMRSLTYRNQAALVVRSDCYSGWS